MNRIGFTAFNQTRMVPVKVYVNGNYVDDKDEFDCTLWVERGEDWYAMIGMKDKRVLVVERDDWIRSPIVA